MSEVQTGTITTKVPARLDRLPRDHRDLLRVKAERQSLENIVRPLTADDADAGTGAGRGAAAPAAS